MDEEYDLVVMGGGLAGLCLATQVKRVRPATSVLVVERRRHPVPEAAFKVGESTAELAGHYLDVTLGLSEHLEADQLRKTGLRFWFSNGTNADLSSRPEIGLTTYLSTRTFQLDRGRLENFLGGHVQRLGCDFVDEARVVDVRLGSERHAVSIRQRDKTVPVSCRWLVDATGRPGILKRRLGLDRPVDHEVNAAWFRVAAKLDVEAWADAPFPAGDLPADWRWRSTNHLMGSGYWFWVIPLASGATSLGLVADPALHPFQEFNSMERMRAWLGVHEPRAAAELARSGGEILDFLVMKHFALGCAQVFSPQRWCLTGEAGLFLDPLYSVGSDFIAIANTLITEFVSRDLDGEHQLESRIALGQDLYYTFFDLTLDYFQGQYPLMQDGTVMTAKSFWDTMSYYTGMCAFFFHDKFRDESFMREVLPEIEQLQRLNREVQAFFREWHVGNLERRRFASAAEVVAFRDGVAGFEAFVTFTRDLVRPKSDAQVRDGLKTNLAYLERLFADMRAEASSPAAGRS